MKIFITEQQKTELEHLHDSSRDKPLCDRIKAILPASEGWNSAMTAQATKISYGWIRKGDRKAVKTTGSRIRLNIMGTLNLKAPESPIICEYKTINEHKASSFFNEIREFTEL